MTVMVIKVAAHGIRIMDQLVLIVAPKREVDYVRGNVILNAGLKLAVSRATQCKTSVAQFFDAMTWCS